MRNKRSRYVFGAAVASVMAGGIPSPLSHAHAELIADFSLEGGRNASPQFGASPSKTLTAGNLFDPFIAETVAGSADGMHANTTRSSDLASDASLFSLASNTWTPDDYSEFNVPTTGLDDMMSSSDEISSTTPSKAFLFRANPKA
jgi:hypothetical protein